jgi:hypothetical protein
VVRGDKYFSEGPPVNSTAINQVHRHSHHILDRCNDGVKFNFILRIDGLDWNAASFRTALAIKMRL